MGVPLHRIRPELSLPRPLQNNWLLILVLLRTRWPRFPRSLLWLTVLGFPPKDNGSASEEAVWLAEDSRKAGFFSEVVRIWFGSDGGARILSKMAEFAESNAQKCSAPSRTIRQRGWHFENWKSGLRLSTILVTVPDPLRPLQSSRLVGRH